MDRNQDCSTVLGQTLKYFVITEGMLVYTALVSIKKTEHDSNETIILS